MSLWYFKLDGRSKPYAVAKKLADGEDESAWQSHMMADQLDERFAQDFDACVWDAETKTFSFPNNTDHPTNLELNQRLKDTATTIDDIKDTVKVIPSVQQMLVQSTQAQAQQTTSNTELKQMMVQMSQGFAQVQATIAKLTATDTTTTE